MQMMNGLWVGKPQRFKKTAERAQRLAQKVRGDEDPLIREVRRLYLTEYSNRWQNFLEDIYTV